MNRNQREPRLDQELHDQLGNLIRLAEAKPEAAPMIAKWTAELIPEPPEPEIIRQHTR